MYNNYNTYTAHEFFDCFGEFAFFKTLDEGRFEPVDLAGCVETYDFQHDCEDSGKVGYWKAEYDVDDNSFTAYIVIDGYEKCATFADEEEAYEWYLERRGSEIAEYTIMQAEERELSRWLGW